MPSARPQPYKDDLEYVEDLFGWVRTRAKRIEAERASRELPDDAPPRRGTVGAVTRTQQQEQIRRLSKLKDAETAARKLIDDRVSATEAAGRVLALDAIVREHDLGDDEKTILLLCTLIACGEDYAAYLQGAGTVGYFGGPLTPEFVWKFCEQGLADRLRSRAAFLPTAPLLKHGLIVLHLGPDGMPADLPTASVEITPTAFVRIIGLAELAPGTPATTPNANNSPF